ncbi:uncharacterized protein LOC142171541 [Nicotiana tabacum]|uniref:Uncharacterized protein LOC142171541 n=3 Tax=Nicotiana tabacum TaxID=4097 RepID=A0AC58SZG8_TOBAC
MEPPDGSQSAHLECWNDLPAMATQANEGISTKNSYASTVNGPQSSTVNAIRHEREAVVARRTTHNGMPAVIFKAQDYYGVMANECKFTIVGRFLKIRPQIEKIRSCFKERIPVKFNYKIGVYDNFNVFMDFSNEDDFKSVWFRRVIEIEGLQMWLQKWSLDFKPEEGIPIAPVWVLLPKLPFHMHTWHYVKQILGTIGTPLELDSATTNRIRPSMAKVRIEIDLLKPLPETVWVGLEDDNSPLKGFIQKLEYECIPKYCKKMGHALINCRILEKKRVTDEKEKENIMKEYDARAVCTGDIVSTKNEEKGDNSLRNEEFHKEKVLGNEKEEENKQKKRKKDIEKIRQRRKRLAIQKVIKKKKGSIVPEQNQLVEDEIESSGTNEVRMEAEIMEKKSMDGSRKQEVVTLFPPLKICLYKFKIPSKICNIRMIVSLTK